MTHPLAYLEKKLAQWDAGVFQRVKAQRGIRVLEKLARMVPPRVIAAVYRTWWDGWCTTRRFSERGAKCKCIWGCKGEDSDSLVHYTGCLKIAAWSQKELHARNAGNIRNRRREFLLLSDPEDAEEDGLFAAAVRIFATYHVHNIQRHSHSLTPLRALNALTQAAKEAVLGHQDAILRMNRLGRKYGGRTGWGPGRPPLSRLFS